MKPVHRMKSSRTAIGKKRNIAASGTFAGCLQKERAMLKTLITVSTVLLATAAFAQTGTKSPGSSEAAPGQKMQKAKTSTAPGASEYAPGHQKKSAKAPGHSGSAPGHQTTTGMATKKKY
jgi:hypothetical protein